MKTLKYLAAGAMLAMCSVANAQDITTDLANLQKVVQSNAGNPAAYKQNLKQMDKLYKKDPEALAKIARMFYLEDDTLNARIYAEKSVALVEKKKLKFCEPYIILGDLRYIDDDPGTAAGWYERAKLNDDRNPKAYEKVAGVYRKANPRAAVENLKELEAIDPSYPANAVAAGFYYDAAIAGQPTWGRTLEYFQKEDINKFREEDYARYVYVLFLYNKYEKCIEVADRGLSIVPDDVTCARYKMYAQNMLGQISSDSAVAQTNFQQAIETSKKLFASEKYKDYADDYRILGEAYCGGKNFTDAQAALNKSLAIEPNQPIILKSIAEIEFAKGNYEKGFDTYNDYLAKYEKVELTDYYTLTTKYDEVIRSTEDETITKPLRAKQDAVFATMLEKYPGKLLVYIYYKRANINDVLDPSGASSAPFLEKLVEAAMAEDAVKHKGTIASVSKRLSDYYTSIENTEKAAYYKELAAQ